MHAWQQIQLTIEFIENHLSEDITIAQLADIAALSPFYFQRLFHRLVKKTPTEYIQLRRMAIATQLLLEREERILDIALSLGFSSHAHFSRIFKKTFGMTPREYRSQSLTLNQMNKPELSLYYTLVDEGVPLICEGIVLEIHHTTLEETQHFQGYEVEMPIGFVDGLGSESGRNPLLSLWDRVHAKKIETGNAKEEELGVSHPSHREGMFTYFAGFASRHEQVQQDTTHYTLYQGDYIVCSFEAENFQSLVMDALYKATQYLFTVWLPQHQLTSDMVCAERYASHGEGTTKMELWVRLR